MTISIFTFGNSARGDDAAGELMHHWLKQELKNGCLPTHAIKLIHEFQLQPEHIYDLKDSELGIFIDCHTELSEPFIWQKLSAGTQLMFSSHSMPVESLLYLYETNFKQTAPQCFLLGISGKDFELGSAPGKALLEAIEEAKSFLRSKLKALQG